MPCAASPGRRSIRCCSDAGARSRKVAAFLIEWAEHTPAGNIVSLAMTRQDIADYLGLTIETVSRTLSQLERDALIELPTARQIKLKNLVRSPRHERLT